MGEEVKGQIYFGSEDFLERMQELADGQSVRGVAKAQTRPKTPEADEIVNTVAREYGISVSQVLDRRHAEAYWLAVYLMRRAGNLSLQEVAKRAGVSIARISQIQTKIEAENISKQMAKVLRTYKLKH